MMSIDASRARTEYFISFPPLHKLPSDHSLHFFVRRQAATTQNMLGYRRVSGLLATLGLCPALLGASGEGMERVQPIRHFINRSSGDEHLMRLIPGINARTGESARPVGGAQPRMMSATTAVLADEEDPRQQQQLHSLPAQLPRRRTQTDCEESSPVSVTSSLSAEYEGCYYRSELYTSDGDSYVIYTPSETPQLGQLWMYTSGLQVDGVPVEGVGARSKCTRGRKYWVLFVYT